MDHRQLVYFVQHNRNYGVLPLHIIEIMLHKELFFYFLALCIERYINASVSEKS